VPFFRFLPLAHIERLLADQPPEVKDIVMELRNLIAGACPEAQESQLWGGLSYHDASKGGRVKGAICMIEYRTLPVRLSFIHGVRLTDPDALLRGARLSKRFVELESYSTAPWQALRALIKEAAGLDPGSFGAG
jgi:hypothetical protein